MARKRFNKDGETRKTIKPGRRGSKVFIEPRAEPLKISRADAVEQGLRFYYTGKPCKHGHTARRYVNGCNCEECILQTNAQTNEDIRAGLIPKPNRDPTVPKQKPIVTRMDAICKGLEYYYTGEPCERGHYSDLTRSGQCLQCMKEAKARRREKERQYELEAIMNGTMAATELND
jgi:hypothetical protein